MSKDNPIAEVAERVLRAAQSSTMARGPMPDPQSVAAKLTRADVYGVPRHYRVRDAIQGAAVDTPALTRVRAVVKSYVDRRGGRPSSAGSRPGLLVVLGPTAAGKTTAISVALAECTLPALYVTTHGMADVPRPRAYDDKEHPWSRWRAVDVLAIDELHADETVIPRVIALLYERHDNGLLTILAGNLDAKVFAARYLGDAALRRRIEDEHDKDDWLADLWP